MSALPIASNVQHNEPQPQATNSITLSEADLEGLSKLPIDSLDTIRSKLVQLIDAITVCPSSCGQHEEQRPDRMFL
jgi:hypothetical protein